MPNQGSALQREDEMDLLKCPEIDLSRQFQEFSFPKDIKTKKGHMKPPKKQKIDY